MTSAATARTTSETKLPPAGTYVFDTQHSSIEAVARHMMVSKVRGRFRAFDGTVQVADDVTDSVIEVEIDAASIDTNQSDRDTHLRSGDFLDVEVHPTLSFRSTDIAHVDGNHYRVTGDLSIRGETHEVVLDTTYFGVTTDPWGNDKVIFEAATELDRERWDITWNQALETGGVLVGKKLKIEIAVQLQAQER